MPSRSAIVPTAIAPRRHSHSRCYTAWGISPCLKLRTISCEEPKKATADIIDTYKKAEADYAVASENWLSASAKFEENSKGYQEAAATYQQLSEEYREITYTLIGLAFSFAVGQAVCESNESTQQFREKMEAQGKSIEGKDVDHIIPKSEGGADNPANYHLMDASENRSCQAGCLGEKFQKMPIAMLGAIAVSAISALNCVP